MDLTTMSVRELLDAFGSVTMQYESDDIRAEIERRCTPPPEVVSSAERIITEGTYDADARTVAEWVGRKVGKIAAPPADANAGGK